MGRQTSAAARTVSPERTPRPPLYVGTAGTTASSIEKYPILGSLKRPPAGQARDEYALGRPILKHCWTTISFSNITTTSQFPIAGCASRPIPRLTAAQLIAAPEPAARPAYL